MMLLLSLAGGCTDDPKGTPDDTGSDTAADDTGTSDSTPPDGTLEGLSFAINERVPTVVNVAWDGTAVAGETFVEYGLDGALDQRTRAGTDASASLLGLKAGRSYSFRAVTLPPEGGRWESEVATVDLAVPPEGLPVFTISDYDPAQAAAGGFILTSLVQVDNSWTIILDRDGDYVWFLQAADGLSIPTSHRTYDGHGVLYTQNDRYGESALGGIVTARLDGSTYVVTNTPLAHHDAVELPRGEIAFLALETREDVELDEGQFDTITADTIGIAPQGAAKESESRTIFSFFDHYEASPWYVCPHFSDEAYNTGGKDWTHANSIMYDEDQAAFLLMSKNLDAMLKIDAATGEVLWQLGGLYGDFTDVDGDVIDPKVAYEVDGPNDTWWSHGHMSHWWPGGFVLFDNGYHHDPIRSRAVEYSYDEATMTVQKVWEFWSETDQFNSLLGDVRKLDNGNYLVSWTNQGLLTEVTPDNEVVWRAEGALGSITGRATYIPDLYGY